MSDIQQTRREIRGRAAWLMLLAGAMVLGGCKAVAYVATVVGGGTKIPALYEMQDRPTLVFVDDPAHKLTSLMLAGHIEARLGQALQDHDVVSKVIDPALINDLRSEHSDFASWPIDKIGRQAGAEQVLYVSIQDWKLTAEGGNIFEPTCEVRVKVVDVASGTRLFPDPTADAGYPLVTQRHHTDMANADASTPTVLARDLADHVASHIAKMFYKHETPAGAPNDDD